MFNDSKIQWFNQKEWISLVFFLASMFIDNSINNLFTLKTCIINKINTLYKIIYMIFQIWYTWYCILFYLMFSFKVKPESIWKRWYYVFVSFPFSPSSKQWHNQFIRPIADHCNTHPFYTSLAHLIITGNWSRIKMK